MGRKPKKYVHPQAVTRDSVIPMTAEQSSSAAPLPTHESVQVNISQSASTNTSFSPFSNFLHTYLQGDQIKIAALAKELKVSEITISRWQSGTKPQEKLLFSLLDVFSEQRTELISAIQQTFPGVLSIEEEQPQRGVGKELYCQVLELCALVEDRETRYWQIINAVFEYAQLHLNFENEGLAITYAQLMPPQQDGYIHSLRESVVRGSPPWPLVQEDKIFLGSNTLAGNAAISNYLLTWDDIDAEMRLQVAIDHFERSACAVPVLRFGKMAGILIFSSVNMGFSRDAIACEAVQEYARLLALALREEDFYPLSCLQLRPMPDLNVQRQVVSQRYRARMLEYLRTTTKSREEVDICIAQEFEREFEEMQQQIEWNKLHQQA